MPSRKRQSTKSQPIRKKRKTGRQTLEKVAQRREDKQLKLDRKIDEADARIQRTRLAALSISIAPAPGAAAAGATPRVPVEGQVKRRVRFADEARVGRERKERGAGKSKEIEGSDSEQSDDDGEQEAEECAKAYNALVGNLARHLYPPAQKSTGVSITRLASSAPSEPVVTSAKSTLQTDASVTSSVPRALSSLTAIGDKCDDPDIADAECRSAFLRETAHFAHLPSDDATTAPLSYQTVAEWPRLRVSAAVAQPTALDNLRRLITTDEPVPLGLQPVTTLKRLTTYRAYSPVLARLPVVRALAAGLRGYHDVLLCAGVAPRVEDTIRATVVAHTVAHVVRARARVARNDGAVRDGGKRDGGTMGDGVDGDAPDVRDRGFARARVAFIVPLRNVAYDVVKLVVRLMAGEGVKGALTVINRDRFEEEFAPEGSDGAASKSGGDGDVDGLDGFADLADGIRTKEAKSADHERLFRGNIDDDFKIGISFGRRAVKLFADFYESDIIVASPLGLRRASAEKATGHDRQSKVMREKRKREDEAEWQSGIDSKKEKRERDIKDDGFFSSIEICVVDGANMLSMQNWDTLRRSMDTLNKIPSNARDTDFSRVREWCLDGLMSKFRQTVVLSRYRKSDAMALFRQFENHAGKVQVIEQPGESGVLGHVGVRLRQTFFKVTDVTSPTDAMDRRLSFFFEHTFPAVRVMVDTQVLLVVPSYFDFVRVRNRLVKIADEDATFQFSTMCEYSEMKDVSRARSRLFDKRVPLVVMTERFHFFWRNWIRGAHIVVWYSLPENCQIYPEVLNMTVDAENAGRAVQSLVLYDQFDTFSLERIVGPKRSRKMTSKTSRSTYLFM